MDDAKTLIDYVACHCTVWPLVRFNQVGKCGKCRHTPREFIGYGEQMTREEAIEKWKNLKKH